MVNKNVFSTSSIPAINAVNNAGGESYKLTPKQALAQIAATNCFNGTYYCSAEDNLKTAMKAAQDLKNDPEFIAKVAVYSRNNAYMKDMPAFLCALLITWGEHKLFRKVFPQVIDNGKMLRNFIQIGRSGVLGKKLNMSSGAIRHAIRDWFKNHNSNFIFRASIGNDPSMRDILRMSRPKPETKEKAALYAYLKGAEFDESTNCFVVKNREGKIVHSNSYDDLPQIVKEFEHFKKTHEGEIPNVDFRMLDSILDQNELKKLWSKQAENANWQTTRMNLNNFTKYGIFEKSEYTSTIANRIKNPELIKQARAYPYQLMNAYYNATGVPQQVKDSLEDALELSLDNIPEIDGKVHICVDVSGSMQDPVTGNRGSVTTKVRCIDVAALFGCAILRKNKSANLMAFDTRVHPSSLNGRDTITTNAKILAKFGGGGTNCSLPLKELNEKKIDGDLVIYISDNESWIRDSRYYFGTSMLNEWIIFKKRNPKAKLVCIDITPGITSQVNNHKDILQVGGFGDQVFDVIASFLKEGKSNNYWVDQISKVTL